MTLEYPPKMRTYSNYHLIDEEAEAKLSDWRVSTQLVSDSGESHPQDFRLLFSCSAGLLGGGCTSWAQASVRKAWRYHVQGHRLDSIYSKRGKGMEPAPQLLLCALQWVRPFAAHLKPPTAPKSCILTLLYKRRT